MGTRSSPVARYVWIRHARNARVFDSTRTRYSYLGVTLHIVPTKSDFLPNKLTSTLSALSVDTGVVVGFGALNE